MLSARPQLIGSAILIDVTLTAALCHWLLGVRRGGLPGWTVVSVAAAGLAIGHLVLPPGIADGGRLALPLMAVVEVAAFMLLIRRSATFTRVFRAARRNGADCFSAIEAGFMELAPFAPGIARWVRLELELWFLCFCGWLVRRRAPSANVFTHHKGAGWSGIATALGMLLLIEGALCHLLLTHFSYATLTWTALGLHVYGLIWLVGDTQALRVYRSYVRMDRNGSACTLEIHIGIRAQTRFPLSRIADITVGNWESAGPGAGMARVAGAANLKLTFHRPIELKTLLRRPVEVNTLLLQVDDPQSFTRAVREASIST